MYVHILQQASQQGVNLAALQEAAAPSDQKVTTSAGDRRRQEMLVCAEEKFSYVRSEAQARNVALARCSVPR